jgi:hypothetical protein
MYQRRVYPALWTSGLKEDSVGHTTMVVHISDPTRTFTYNKHKNVTGLQAESISVVKASI